MNQSYPILMQISGEDVEKLSEAKPVNLAAARRIPGVTPAAIVLLLQHVRRRQRLKAASAPRARGYGLEKPGESDPAPATADEQQRVAVSF